MCLMISAEVVGALMEKADAAMASGDAEAKKKAAEEIETALQGASSDYVHFGLLKNYRKALIS